ncbi:23S RNA-specific pseudouridylate synthase [Oleiphilus messinensis]|uniref:Pseudouridine synthase n=1 Tax=Oleiphilus messinensis TaxID=141451 RepID=A0A1Y0I3W8_9GAMM|nr:23S rRNA pseudouridine(1911/1915/1917) synthase RluD [Oleiphilus messinensis]ARU54930.1 23S RNA-specific pseudouridylate synthase [Oleiphilus messinensis]
MSDSDQFENTSNDSPSMDTVADEADPNQDDDFNAGSDALEVIHAEFAIPLDLAEKRLDQAVAAFMPEHSRGRIQGWIKSGALTLNGAAAKAKDKVIVNDKVAIRAEIEGLERWSPEAIPLDIVFEDEHILVVNKPVGLVVHPAAGHPRGTLVNALLHHCPEVDKLPRAGIVHRLDKDTSGLMVVAKSLIAHTSLVNQLQDRSMGREYEAIACGMMTGGGTVHEPISRHPHNRLKMAVHPTGKDAVTHYRVLEKFAAFTHIHCKLETGRTHQIRVHLAHIHHPLVGDPIYGGRLKLPSGANEEITTLLRSFTRQALHARRLQLIHPASQELLYWEVDLPDDMLQLLEGIRKFDAQRG